MPAKKFALLVILLTMFSACKDDNVKTTTSTSSNTTSSDTVNGRVDLGGTGVVNYRKVDADTPKDTVVDTKTVANTPARTPSSTPKDTKGATKIIINVKSIQFYENYIVVESRPDVGSRSSEGHVIKISDLISFDWR